MSQRVNLRKIAFCLLVAAIPLVATAASRTPPPPVAPPPPTGGIGQAAGDLAAQALDDLNKGNLTDAASAYNSLLQRFPNAGEVPEALFRLGYIEYVQGDYDNAIATLKRITSPPATPEITAAGEALIPQILAAQAAKLPPDDPHRKQSFHDAIAQFDAYIQQHPNSPDVETANYGRAVAAFQAGDFDSATQSLRANLTKFPASPSILDSEDLLAVVLTAQASAAISDHTDIPGALAKFDEALRHLANIIQRHTDVALANDAQFQIGEVLYNRAAAEQGDKRDADLAHAIDAYRAVQPKDAMLQAQQDRVASLLPEQRQAILSRNPAAIQAVQRLQDRENAKLNAMKSAPDSTMNAQLRIASSYYMLQRFDEARVLLRYLQPFASEDDQKKQIEYFLVLTYASQGITTKAVSGYDSFQSLHRGDPMAENLPLAMGAAFLSPKNNQPEKAIEYFQEEMSLYPKSPLVNEALSQEAAAFIGLKRFDEALGAYNKFLQTNPPAAQAAAAEQGIAMVYQQTGKLPDAIKQYQKVAEKYGDTPQGEQCGFYAAGLEISVDPKKAAEDLQAYVKKYPQGKFTAQAMMMIGQVQASTGDTTSAMQTYKDLASKFPSTEFAPQAYFQQAAILGKQDKIDDMIKLLQDFIKKYPDDKNVFYAYDTIGQTQVTKGQIPQAIATYTDMAENHSDNPMAPAALYRPAELWRKLAEGMGNYTALNDTQRADWNTDLSNSLKAAGELIKKYPDSDQVGVALKTLLADQQMLIASKQKSADDLAAYFHVLADRFKSNPSARSRILFTLATFTYQKDPAAALGEMVAAYNPALVYAPADLDLYGQALIEQGKSDDAYKIYQKIANDYPVPPGQQPAQAQPAIQEAQAMAIFGMASALSKEGRTADAGKLFAQLKATYPWSPKVVEANFGIAKSLVDQNKADDALKLLTGIVANRNAPANLRAHAFLLIGQIQEIKGNTDAAIDSYLKTAAYYGGVPDAAAEGLYKGAQMLEKQAATLTDQTTPTKSGQIAKAVSSYKDLIAQYSDSKFAQPAQLRLTALGAK